ncbi:MAG TPA: cyclic nucleotide-binding domain-containing protein [Desulfatiglandales bacterium]|nr:cyclic nucleotide-binding domain-containing protein [Desulfatiglandales bacterium]
MNASEVIRKTFIFNDLEDQEVQEILKISQERGFSKGEVITREGEQGDSMFILVEGNVEVSKTLTMKLEHGDFTEREKILTRFKPEDNLVFGEIAVIDREKRSASVVTTTDCILLEIKRDDFLELLDRRPEMGVKVLRRLARLLATRLRQSSQDVIRLTTALSVALSS